VVIGAFRKTFVRRRESKAPGLDAGRVAREVHLLSDVYRLNVEPRARLFQDVKRASMISGPMPSPWATVMECSQP
jgi:hypothetical protein